MIDDLKVIYWDASAVLSHLIKTPQKRHLRSFFESLETEIVLAKLQFKTSLEN